MDFTVTLRQNAATVASTTNEATFSVVDGWCYARFKVTATAAGGAGLITVLPAGLPAPLDSASGYSLADGSFFYTDVSVGRYEGAVRQGATTGILSFRVDNSTADLGTTPSFLIASTDSLSCSYRYPVA